MHCWTVTITSGFIHTHTRFSAITRISSPFSVALQKHPTVLTIVRFVQAPASGQSLNEIADSTDLSAEDSGSKLSISLESREDGGDSGEDSHDSTSHESHEGNRFLRKVSSGSMESHSEDRKWSTWDNDDRSYFRLHPAIHRKWANDKDSHGHSHSNEIDGEGSDDQSANTESLVSILTWGGS